MRRLDAGRLSAIDRASSRLSGSGGQARWRCLEAVGLVASKPGTSGSVICQVGASHSAARCSSRVRSRMFRVSAAARRNSAAASSWRPEPGQQVAADAGQVVVAGQRRFGGEAVDNLQAKDQ